MSRTSTIIKSGTLSAAQKANIQPVEMVDLIMEAKGVLSHAKEEARRLAEQTRTEADALRRSAQEEGYACGYQEGHQAGHEAGHQEALATATAEFERSHQNLVATCRQLVDEINAQRASWQAAARHDLVDLAMAIATRVAHVVGERERSVVLANIEKAVELAGRRSQVTLVIHPKDAETARQFAPSLFESQQEESHVAIREDDSISSGGCRLEWGTGAVDATLETQLDRIRSELRNGSVALDPRVDVNHGTAPDEETSETDADDTAEQS